MERFKVERTSIGDITTEFPHSPEDRRASVEEFIEDRFSDGLELVDTIHHGTEFYFVFRVVGRTT